MIVAKFGGSSLACADQIKKTKSILRSNPERRFVVVSAPGKRSSDDIKITDLLYACYHLRQASQSIDETFNKIRERFLSISRELELKRDMNEALNQVYEAIRTGASRDYVASRGEYLLALLLSEYLDLPFVDAKDVIRFDENKELDLETTDFLMSKALIPLSGAIVPGFYGADAQGEIYTFTRGGGDISGALVARGINADLYENWTDVNGFRSADPRIVSDASYISCLSYRELRELSYMGATVLHEDAVFPVRKAGIPTSIRNTNDPLHPGTTIRSRGRQNNKPPCVAGIAGKSGFSIITLEKDRMNAEVGFGRKVLEIFENHHLNFEHLPTGIDALSVMVSSDGFAPKADSILSEIKNTVSPESIKIHDHIALVACVGDGMFQQHGAIARLFTAVAQQGISIHTMVQAPSELSIIIGVDDTMLNQTVICLYNAFIRT